MMQKIKELPVGVRLAAGGVAAGFINGLLGAGGGIVIIFVLSKIFARELSDKCDVFANALCIMLPISLLSCALYFVRGDIQVDGFGIFIIPALLGGALGGIALGRIRSGTLKKIFSSLVVVSGALLIIR